MSKMTIEWHEECLQNSKNTQRRVAEELKFLQERMKNLEVSNEFHEYQIKEAKAKGLDGFDSYRFKRSERIKRGLL
jgi:hypothetical protein